MMSHPSLYKPFRSIEPLRPQRKMDPYAECWCRSGKKWKWCHKNRADASPTNVGEALARLRDRFTTGYCSFPKQANSPCSGRVIRAHTVQRRGGLAAVAEDGHVFSALSAAEDLAKNQGKFIPRKVGIRSASTFPGFCNRHDTELFRPAETGQVLLSDEVCFLLSFRAISYELFAKQAQFQLIHAMRDADSGKPFELQCDIQEFIHSHGEGIRRGLVDMQRWKNQYDSILLERSFREHEFAATEFSGVLPVVGCGAFMPECDFQGQPLQRISHGTELHEHVTFNLSVLDGKSVVVFGTTERAGGPARQLLNSFAGLDNQDKADAAIRCAFEFVGNIFFRPSWWQSLDDDAKNALIARLSSGSPFRDERNFDCLRPDGFQLAAGVNVLNCVASPSQDNLRE